MARPLVFFDLETGGLDPDAPLIQLSAVAVSLPDWKEQLPSFNSLIKFDEAQAEPKALEVNHYDPQRWENEAKPLSIVLADFATWIRAFTSIPMQSKRGSTYYLAQLAGYNTEAFDSPRLRAAFRDFGLFYPAHYRTLDVLQLAAWDALRLGEIAPSLKLTETCHRYAIPTDGAHDALADVRMTIALARKIMVSDSYSQDFIRPILENS
jgi:DNA polymerase III epsilon subunit-like protein